MRASSLRFSFALSAMLCSSGAAAHFDLVEPKAADKSTNGGKGSPPCGPASDSGIVTPVTGGSELTIRVNETVSHPGFYRIALALKDRSELPMDNIVRGKDGQVLPPDGPGNSVSADFQASPKFPVLADNLWPHTDGSVKTFTHKLTLPNVSCDKCTLQVIEFMAQHGPDYFYRHCADLKITPDPSKPIFDPLAPAGGAGGMGGMGNGGTSAGGTTAGGSGGNAAGGMGGSSSGGVATGGTGGSSSDGTPGTGGSSAAGGSSSGGSAMAGSATTTGGSGASAGSSPAVPATTDDGGCAVSGRPRGTAGLLGALGLGYVALRRRRRAS